jgi:hypothetical protein
MVGPAVKRERKTKATMHPVSERPIFYWPSHDGRSTWQISTRLSWKGLLFAFMRSFLIVAALALCLRLAEQSFSAVYAKAATYASYDAMIVSVSSPRTLAIGTAAQATVTFRNAGSATWFKEGSNFVSIYRWDPLKKQEVPSVFSTTDWETTMRPVRLPVSSVVRGKEVTFSFPIQAPTKIGRYQEEFILTAENAAWIKNGRFTIDVEVTPSPSSPIPSIPQPIVPSPNEISGTNGHAKNYAAEIVDQGGREWQLEVEEKVSLPIKIKNIGTVTWYRDGDQAVYLYAFDQGKERTSAFADANWSGPRAASLRETQIKPGEIGTFILPLRAPQAPGEYQERFALLTANKVQIVGGQVLFPIKIPLRGQFLATQTPAPNGEQAIPAEASVPKGAYAAILLLRSFQERLTLLGNGKQELTFGFKNTGTSAWASRSVRFKDIQPTLEKNLSSVRDESWVNTSEAVELKGAIKSGEIGFLSFRLKAPAKKGSYEAVFQLYADGSAVEGGEIRIPITVTSDGYIEPEVARPTTPSIQPSYPTIEAVPLNGDISSLPAEPLIRVGLYRTTDDRMVVRAKYVPLQVVQNGQSSCQIPKGGQVAVRFDRTSRVYQLSGDCQGQSTSHYLIRAEDGVSPMEIADYSRPISWLPGSNDNTFRTQLELRYTPATDQVWVINELAIEPYLKGIAETSNISPQQYQRALLTAARTYAMYHVQRGTKHANEFFIVDAHLDQVYRGYGSEARSPNIATAVESTRGQIVTHGGKLAITPYFSRSDGRTRSWGEVWYGGSQYPWLVGVTVPQDNGKTLWGHGVGMSATGALGMANEGKVYDEILKHFYTGTELRRAYK